MNTGLEFIVSGAVEGTQLIPGGHRTAIGRCGDSPIRVEQAFNVAYRNRGRRFPEELGDAPVREEEHSVDLHVKHIQVLGRCLKEMGEGMTGSLILQGAGLQFVAPGWILAYEDRDAAPGVADGADAAVARKT